MTNSKKPTKSTPAIKVKLYFVFKTKEVIPKQITTVIPTAIGMAAESCLAVKQPKKKLKAKVNMNKK